LNNFGLISSLQGVITFVLSRKNAILEFLITFKKTWIRNKDNLFSDIIINFFVYISLFGISYNISSRKSQNRVFVS